MKKRILKTLALSLLAQFTFGQNLPSNPVYEFSKMGGFMSEGRTVDNAVTKHGGPSYATDRFGNPLGATSLSGLSYVQVNGANLDFGRVANTSHSYSVWVKLASNTTSQNIFTKARNNWTGSAQFDYGLSFDRNHGFLAISGPSTDAINYAKTGVRPSVGAWTHIVMIIEQTGTLTGNKKVYVNGVKKIDAAYSAKGSAYTGSPLVIGKSKSGSLYYTGDIDDFFIYDKALTATDVANLYNATEVDYSEFPTLDLRFDGDYADSSAYNNKVLTSGLSFRKDRHGKANGAVYQSSNSSSVLKVENSKTLDFGTGSGKAFSFSFWFKHINSNSSKSFSLLTKAKQNWSTSSDFDYGVTNHLSEVIPFTGQSSDAVNYPRNKFNTSDTLWHHLVIACNQTGTSSGTKTVYFDGSEVFNGNYSKKGAARDYDLIFGRGNSTKEPYEGLFDDILIYQKELSSVEVDNIYRTNDINATNDVELNLAIISIYPNPATNVINVNNGIGQEYLLTNTLGNVLQSGVISTNGINISSEDSGIYFITISNEKNTETFKFIKQ